MIFYFSILRVIKLLTTDTAIFCCFALSFQYISNLCHRFLWKRFIPLLFPQIQCALQISLNSLYKNSFSLGEEHLHKQKSSVHIIQTVHVCWPFLYMVSHLFAQSSFDFSLLGITFDLSLLDFKMIPESASSIKRTLNWYTDHREILTFFLS